MQFSIVFMESGRKNTLETLKTFRETKSVLPSVIRPVFSFFNSPNFLVLPLIILFRYTSRYNFIIRSLYSYSCNYDTTEFPLFNSLEISFESCWTVSTKPGSIQTSKQDDHSFIII